MQSLEAFLDQQVDRSIYAIGRYIQQHIDERWETIYQQNRAQMLALYEKIGDSAYGRYGKRLFAPIQAQFKQMGIHPAPQLPGNFMTSREWGPEDDRQRWMWSRLSLGDGAVIGTIATAFFHDHGTIRIPRAFRIIALEESRECDVIQALSRHLPEFEQAIDAKAEIAEYLAQLSQGEGAREES